MVKVKICKNYKNKTYTGKENTPLGRGYHAEGEKVKSTMKGKNGSMYEVVKTKKGKRWQKINKKRMTSPRRTKRGGLEGFISGYQELPRPPNEKKLERKFNCKELLDKLIKYCGNDYKGTFHNEAVSVFKDELEKNGINDCDEDLLIDIRVFDYLSDAFCTKDGCNKEAFNNFIESFKK